MAKKRKRGEKWMLFCRREEQKTVYSYEPVQKHSLKARIREGWRVIT